MTEMLYEEKINMILYGEENTGKTSTLMYLAALLAGSGRFVPSIWTKITSLFFSGRGTIKDAKFIVDYKGKLIDPIISH